MRSENGHKCSWLWTAVSCLVSWSLLLFILLLLVWGLNHYYLQRFGLWFAFAISKARIKPDFLSHVLLNFCLWLVAVLQVSQHDQILDLLATPMTSRTCHFCQQHASDVNCCVKLSESLCSLRFWRMSWLYWFIYHSVHVDLIVAVTGLSTACSAQSQCLALLSPLRCCDCTVTVTSIYCVTSLMLTWLEWDNVWW